jgi:leucyl aminopeptidase (aminopeptidase T)
MPGARTAIEQCLNVAAGDRVFIMTDAETRAIGAALHAAAEARDATVKTTELEVYGERPFLAIPAGLVADLKAFQPSATVYAAQGQPGEIRFRIPLGALLRQDLHVRHGHMIGIDEHLMTTGMTANYLRVAELTEKVNAVVAPAREIRVTNADGTNFRVHLAPERLRWVPCTGLYHRPGQWGNLPEGETFTSPAAADGVLTANVLGDYFSRKYGLLQYPMYFEIEDGRVVRVEHHNPDLAAEVWNYLDSAKNGTRVGEFAIGTNTAITALCGNLLQDEKYPGIHVAFGNPYPDLTGASWASEVHVDVVPLDVDIWVDGVEIMTRGRFQLD